MEKIYKRINWENEPSEKTPLSAQNLNAMDKGINDLDDRIITLDNRVSGGTIIQTYVVGGTPFASNWLSLAYRGAPLSPTNGVIYVVMSYGDYYKCPFIYDGEKYVQVGMKMNRKIFSQLEEIPLSYSYGGYSWYSKVLYVTQFPNDPDFAGTIDIVVDDCACTALYYLTSIYQPGNHYDYRQQYAFENSIGGRKRVYIPLVDRKAHISYKIQPEDLGLYFGLIMHLGGNYAAHTITGHIDYYSAGNRLYTYDYISKTTITDSAAGLIPKYNGDGFAVFTSDGKWHSIDEFKQILDGTYVSDDNENWDPNEGGDPADPGDDPGTDPTDPTDPTNDPINP